MIFFFASAAASSAYLTVSETFPLEIRALAIAFFYAIGTGDRRHRRARAVRRADRHRLAREPVRRLSARRVLMIAAGLIAAFFAVPAERKPLEQVARPLAFVD